MTKEQYIKMRQDGNFNIVYEYYKEKFQHDKHKPFLGIQDVANLLIQLDYNVNNIMGTCVEHYDQHFGIVKLSDKDGNLIKIL